MENHIKVSGVQEKDWVNSIIANMDKIHFSECHCLQNESYPTFRMKLINMFENPNMSQALMAEWADVRQLECDDITNFMTRIQYLVAPAFLG